MARSRMLTTLPGEPKEAFLLRSSTRGLLPSLIVAHPALTRLLLRFLGKIWYRPAVPRQGRLPTAPPLTVPAHRQPLSLLPTP